MTRQPKTLPTMLKASFPVLLFVGIMAACAPGTPEAASGEGDAVPDTTQRRYVEGNTLVSTYLPPLRVKVDTAFVYAGSIDFILKDIARVHRYVFVDADAGQRIERLFIFQFEGFLDTNDHVYRYRFPNPLMLGGIAFRPNTWYYDDAAEIARNPGAESERTRAFLEGMGYRLDPELMMSRFVAVVDEARRNELILYYLENVRDTGYTLAELATDGGDIRPEHAALDTALVYRSRRAFTVHPAHESNPNN